MIQIKIGIFGVYPPPFGGRSIHIKRLIMKVEEKKDIISRFLGDKNKNYLLYFFMLNKFFRKKFDIVHTHNKESYKELLAILFFRLFYKYKIILTFHSFREEIEKFHWLKKNIFKFIFFNIDSFICVGIEEKKKLIRYVNPSKIKVIPGYLNPIENIEDINKIPEKVVKFIDNSKFLISANGAIRFYKNEDLYGLDMLIEVMKRLEVRRDNIRLLFCVLSMKTQSEKEKRYYRELKEKIAKLYLQEKIMLYEVEKTEFYPILKKSDIFIRPTNTDSYGVSIAEAIYYDVPSIASGVCDRPEGTILFKTRNQEDLIEKINQVIDNYPEEKEKVKNIEVKDYFDELYRVYEELGRRN